MGKFLLRGISLNSESAIVRDFGLQFYILDNYNYPAVMVATILATVTHGEAQIIGEGVTLGVIAAVQDSGIFLDDNRLLKRIACVESNYGQADGVNLVQNGGIWQVWSGQNGAFEDTKNTDAHPDLVGKIAEIQQSFEINWSEVMYTKLQEPFYSALAARLYISNVRQYIPHFIDVRRQAAYWKNHYHHDGNEDLFIKCALQDLNEQDLDIAFVLDNSGSIKKNEFQNAKDFVLGFTNCLKIGLDSIRVGVIEYSHDNHKNVVFKLNDMNNNNDVRAAIDAIQYVGGDATKTGEAIDLMRTGLFVANGGARADKPDIGIVITDGVSHDDILKAADAARGDDIVMFAIAVRDMKNLNAEGLKKIANKPDDVYVSTFSEFGADCAP